MVTCLGLLKLPGKPPPAPEMTDEVPDSQVMRVMSSWHPQRVSAIKSGTGTGSSLIRKPAVLLTLVMSNRAGQWPAMLTAGHLLALMPCYLDHFLNQKFCFTTKCWKNSFKIWQTVAQSLLQIQIRVSHRDTSVTVFWHETWPLRSTVQIWNKHWCCWVLGAVTFLITTLREETEDCKTQQVGDGVTLNNGRHTINDVGVWWREKRSSCTWERRRGGL